MNSFRQIFYHIVFCTYKRKNTLPTAHHQELYRYIWGIIKKRKGILYQINGTENHIHILSDLHPSVCLSDYIKEIKTASNRWMKSSDNFQSFDHWAEGSCSLTYCIRDKDMIVNYIKNQKEHHKTIHFEDELKTILVENDIDWNEKYLF
ncbi:Transposase IS200 like [Saccharicrinis carchari]|uniref:Transposase IS200 like n=1 Tax=Saccharicrinis carchari TaxID=1168039 RepID=A0A521EBP7_SACCC|nr:IS200/IS605 family transposase [Saccharicrinis carchari]SMO81337.1 Transposase IS200 like [Saccharicrinis carchari]